MEWWPEGFFGKISKKVVNHMYMANGADLFTSASPDVNVQQVLSEADAVGADISHR